MRTDTLAMTANAVARLREDLLARYPDLREEDEFLADTLEGATDFNELATAVIASALNDDTYCKAIDTRIEELKARRDRLANRCSSKRGAVQSAMEIAGVKKIEAPEATISLRAVPPSVVITDETLIPETYKEIRQTVHIDKRTLKEALSKGPVPGAELTNGSMSISIRTR